MMNNEGSRPAYGLDGLEPRAYLAGGGLHVETAIRSVGAAAVFVPPLAAPAVLGAGTPDSSFGAETGRVIVPGSTGATIEETVRLADGRMLIASNPGALRLTRLRLDGSPDTTYGPGGSVTVNLGGTLDRARMFVRADGKVVIAYQLFTGDLIHPASELGIARVNANGTLDTTFGTAGRRKVTVPGSFQNLLAAAMDSAGRVILVTGNAVARLNADGSIDKTFGNEGVTSLAVFATAFAPVDLVLTPDGGVAIAGGAATGNPVSPDRIAVARLDTAGKLVTTFGVGGLAQFAPTPAAGYEFARSIAVRPDGRLVIAGARYATNAQPQHVEPLVLRVTTRGTLDGSFGAGGRAITPVGGQGAFEDVSVLPDGRVVAYGYTRPAPSVTTDDAAIVRLLANGQVDSTFGTGGKVVTDFGGVEQPSQLIVAPDGGLIVSGRNASGIFVGRYIGDPLTITFADGTLTVTGTSASDSIIIKRGGDGEVYVNGRPELSFFQSVKRLVIKGLGGDDVIDASSLGSSGGLMYGPLVIPTTLDGGDGNDSIVGGPGRDVIYGGNENDSITAGLGDDTVFAGGGNDSVRGGDGNDYLNGGPGADRVFGDAGNDQIFGVDAAVDQIDGGAGFDRAKGDPNDLLVNVEGLLA